MATSAMESTSSTSLNSFSPISTLELQGLQPWGQRLVIAVQANSACCVEGGVESILRLKHGDTLSTQTVSPAANFEENPSDDFDAFAFLHEGGEKKGDEAAIAGDAGNKQGIGGFFRKVAASASTTLERQMQGLAVRIDQGRNPDLLRIAMYDQQTNELLDLTEAVPVPSERSDVRFEVPLTLPAALRQRQVLLKLWIQSGATLLQSTKVAKNYLLAMASVDCSKITLGIQRIPLTSKLVVGGQLELCAIHDPKFASVDSDRSWSVTDPDMSAYSSRLNYLPLDKTYCYKSNQPSQWLVATERATESSVVLPIAASVMDLAARASLKSLHHAQSVAKTLRANRHDFKDASKSTCSLGITGVVTTNTAARFGNISVNWRRPDSMFELEIVANEVIPISGEGDPTTAPQLNVQFHPKLCTEDILPGVLNAFGGRIPPSGYLLGSLFFSLSVQSNNEYVEIWEASTAIESYVNNQNTFFKIPLVKNGVAMGSLLLHLQVTLPTEKPKFASIPSNDGLVSLVGLENLSNGVNPLMDADTSIAPKMDSLRHQQLATMGYFFTVQYMEQHLSLRQSATESLQDRARAYRQALMHPENVQPYEVRSPKAFRPSSSRPTSLLSGIPFNVHVSTLNISLVDSLSAATENRYPGASFHNITHGAPSDHARGFGNILSGISNTNASGGLRRLEKTRTECADALEKAQNLLIAAVGNYLANARKTSQVNHVPARHAEIQGLRWKVFECVHNLHHVTWMCAVRRANVFSQSLGLAVTSYLTSISDKDKCAAGWPAVWQRNGYLVCFEGLLSAAGKELGMIEDASVAVAMLRMVRIVIMPDTGIPSKAVGVQGSRHLKWVNLFSSGQGSHRQFLLQVGVDQTYYQDRIPDCLKNGTAVQLYPVLFQVGVDIRQWGAHAGSNLMKNGKQEISSGLVDDEDDDIGVVDDDVLVALNFEALRKMNAYAHAINPQNILLDKVQEAMTLVFLQRYGSGAHEGEQILPVHPSLSLLHSHIMSSAGKMNHAILDEAATLAQQLGGGGLVFCKSGKDRTAMHVTYKQAQFSNRYRNVHNGEATLQDANLMRIYGVRLPICEKNVGQAKFAFNALQVKFMPEALKPPMSVLKGFKLFGEGAIES